MKKLFASILLLFLSNHFIAQTSYRTYQWNEAKNLNPDTVYSITFEKEKIDSIPLKLMRFINLKSLNLGKNKLSKLPDSFSQLSKLEILNLEKNNFDEFPIIICELSELKQLIINRNNLTVIPYSIGKLTKLEFIDIWSTPVINFPDIFLTMKNLKRIDARGVSYGPKFQKYWTEKLNWVTIEFEPPCNCFE